MREGSNATQRHIFAHHRTTSENVALPPSGEPPARGVILAGGIVRVLYMTVYEPPRLYIRNPAA